MGGKKGHFVELNLWSTISKEVQYNICKWKFNHYAEVRQDLMKSGNKILIHPALRCSNEKIEIKEEKVFES